MATKSNGTLFIFTSLTCIVDFLKNQGYIAAAPNGATGTITSPNSYVTLQVPEEAIQEVVIGRVYTDVSKFAFHISENECPIFPSVEYIQKFIKDENVVNANRKFQIHIPHKIGNLTDNKHHVKVRYGNLHQTEQMLKLAQMQTSDEPVSQSKDEPVSYEITNQEVIIYTTYLTGFLVTISRAVCFSKGLELQFFGSLTRRDDGRCIAKVTVLLHNPLQKQYEKVCKYALFTTLKIFLCHIMYPSFNTILTN